MASDLEAFAADPGSKPSPTTPEGSDRNSDILGFYNQPPSAKPLSYAVSTAREVPPDAAAKTLTLQSQTGLPADVIARDPKDAEDIASKQNFNAEQYQKDHPVVSQWLQDDQNHASVAQNDLENLGYMERLFGSMKSAYQQTKLTNERAALGLTALRGTITSQQRDRLAQIDQEMQTIPDYGMKGAGKIPGLMVDFATSKSTIRGVELGAVGGAAGLIAGGIGAVPGAGIGLTAGFAGQGALDAAGHAYLDFEKMPGVDRSTAVGASLMVGELNGALMLAPIGKVAETIPGLSFLGKKGIQSMLESPALMDVFQKYAKTVAEQAGIQGGIGGVQSMVSSMASDLVALHGSGDLAKMSPGAILSTLFRDENLQKAKSATTEGALTGVGVGAVTGVTGIPRDLQAISDAKNRALAFKQLGETVQNSQVFQKIPQKTQEIVSRLTKDGPQENVFLPIESWQNYWQGKKVDPREAAESVTGDTKAYDEAIRTGTDLRIPTDKYAVTLAPTEHNAYFQEELRNSPNQMNAREADAYLKEELEKAKVAAQPKPEEEAAGKVAEDVTRQLQETGFDKETASTYSKLYESAFKTIGERSGIDPLELYQKYGLKITGPDENVPRGTFTTEGAGGPEAGPQDGLSPQSTEPTQMNQPGIGPVSEESVRSVFPGPEDPSLRSITGESDYIKMSRKAAEITRRYATERGIEPTPDLPKKLWQELHDAFNEVRMAKPEERAAIAEKLKAQYPNLESDFITLKDQLYSDKVDPYYERFIRGQNKYEQGPAELPIVAQGSKTGDPHAVFIGKDNFGPGMTERDLFNVFGDPENQTVKKIGWGSTVGREAIDKAGIPITGKSEGAKGEPFTQFKQGSRASMSFGPDRQFNIQLLQKADLSSFLHETGHFYLEVLGDAATHENATPELKEDFQKALDYLGVKDRSEIETKHHEQWAKSFETYLMEGKAPSAELRGPFARFRSWLVSIYKDMTHLGVNLTPEVKGVFDRLLASREAIDLAQKQQAMEPMFADPKAVGMSDKQAESYTKAIQEAKQSAEDELFAKQTAELLRQQSKTIEAEKETLRNQFAKTVDEMPDQQARAFLKNGTFPDGKELPEGMKAFKLSKESIKEDFPKQDLNQLRGLYSVKEGVHPDEAAGIFGFKNGQELLTALAHSQDRDALIESMVNLKIKDLHGDLMNPGELRDAAMDAVHNTKRAQVLQKELEHLVDQNFPAMKGLIRQMTRRIPRLEEVTQQAERMVNASLERDIHPSLYSMAEAREGRQAGIYLTQGDIHGAFEAKQRELLNHEAWRAATQAIEDREKAIDYLQKFDKESVRDRLAQGGRDGGTYLEQIDALLDRFDVRKSVSLKELGERKDLATWAMAERTEKGYDISVPDKFMDEAFRTHWKDMAHEDFMDLRDTVKNIEHLARNQAEIFINGVRENFEKVVTDLQASARSYHDIKENAEPAVYTKSMADKYIKGMKYHAAEHIMPEFQFQDMDGYHDNGPWWTAMFKRTADAENQETLWRKESVEAIKKAMDDHYEVKEQHELWKRIDTPEIENRTLSKMNLLMMAANHGNRYNLEGMIAGERGNISEGQMQMLMEKHLTLNDWKFVQALSDHINSWWPKIAEMEKRVNGLAPEKVKGDPISMKTADGKVFKSEGWYWPIKFDPERDLAAKKTDAKEQVEDMFGGSYAKAQTKQGHIQARTWTAGRPFLLDFSTPMEHLSNMVHDLSHREAVIDINKLLSDSRVKNDVISVQGKEGYEQLNSWLRRVAGEKFGQPASKTEGLIGTVRANATTAAVGLRLSSAMKHMLNYGFSWQQVGAEYSAKGFADIWAKPWEMKDKFNFIAERSPGMANRQLFMDRDLREYWRGFQGLTRYDMNIQKSFVMFMNGFDLATSMPAWMGAYRKGMEGKAENITAGDERSAIAYADSIVRTTKGSFSGKDMPTVMTGSPAWKLFTMFYGPLNVGINNMNKVRGQFVQERNIPALISGAALTWFVPALLHPRIGKGISDDDKDHPIKSMAEDIALWPIEQTVFGRTVAEGAKMYKGHNDNAFSQFLTNVGKTASIPFKLLGGEEDEISRQDINAAIDTAGSLRGIPTRQIWQYSEYLYDWLVSGEEQPDTVFQGLKEMAFGKHKE